MPWIVVALIVIVGLGVGTAVVVPKVVSDDEPTPVVAPAETRVELPTPPEDFLPPNQEDPGNGEYLQPEGDLNDILNDASRSRRADPNAPLDEEVKPSDNGGALGRLEDVNR